MNTNYKLWDLIIICTRFMTKRRVLWFRSDVCKFSIVYQNYYGRFKMSMSYFISHYCLNIHIIHHFVIIYLYILSDWKILLIRIQLKRWLHWKCGDNILVHFLNQDHWNVVYRRHNMDYHLSMINVYWFRLNDFIAGLIFKADWILYYWQFSF